MGNGKTQKRQFAEYPKYKENYIKAFDRMIKKRIEDGLPPVWNSGEECFTWWVGDDVNQITMDDMIDPDWAYV
jgi:phosphoadenosine phosphosulfate reductase